MVAAVTPLLLMSCGNLITKRWRTLSKIYACGTLRGGLSVILCAVYPHPKPRNCASSCQTPTGNALSVLLLVMCSILSRSAAGDSICTVMECALSSPNYFCDCQWNSSIDHSFEGGLTRYIYLTVTIYTLTVYTRGPQQRSQATVRLSEIVRIQLDHYGRLSTSYILLVVLGQSSKLCSS
jgi:hypothetical protein